MSPTLDVTQHLSASTRTHVRNLPEAECYEMLAVATVGRIGFVGPNGLIIQPIDYRLGPERCLFMLTAPGGIISQLAEMDADIAFEVDYHANDFGIAWSVLMHGALCLLDAPSTIAYRALRRPPVPWTGDVSSLPVRFTPHTISGRGLDRR